MTTFAEGSSPRRPRIIAIDGPAGSGKSTTARLLASRLDYQYLDTGAMYRVVTLIALREGVEPADAVRLKKIAESIHIGFRMEGDVNHVVVENEDVTDAIRSPEVTRHVSEISAHPGVRKALVAVQKEIGKQGGVVAEGRDTTTVVFPGAELKIFLRASIDERAKRRLADLDTLGVVSTAEEQAADLERRDAFDSGREHSPLLQAKDAVEVDTSNCTIEEQVAKILSLFHSVQV